MCRKIPILLALIMMTGCFDTDLVFEDQYRIVVESYLYVGSRESTLNLTSMISFGNDSTGGEAISGALVTLSDSQGEWIFEENDTVPSCYTLNSGPELVPGDIYNLVVNTPDQELKAITTIPEPPPAVDLSANSISIPKVEDMGGFHDLEWPDPIELTWDNPLGKFFFIKIENVESNPSSIMPDPPDGMLRPGNDVVFRMISRPTNEESYVITPRELTHYGTHRIVFYRVNDEYVNLYKSLEQDSHELNEPFSNVENGLGIFTAFNSDTLFFEVRQ